MKYIPSFVDPSRLTEIYSSPDIPVFQNVVYPDPESAKTAQCRNMQLMHCAASGFIFNAEFDSSLLDYSTDYQNEQGHSPVFHEHLLEVKQIAEKHIDKNSKVVEIGCGKGTFFEMLRSDGYNITGFDPAYEGESKEIVKEYFGKSHRNLNAEFIILRHTLEHIPDPLLFLKEIAESANSYAKIYIEVPTFEWIANKQAVWDIFYEHCNYFTVHSLSNFFTLCETGDLFGGQYIYLVANLSVLKNADEVKKLNDDAGKYTQLFSDLNHRFNSIIGIPGRKIIWGAGGKGSTFLNLFDGGKKYFDYVVDINPLKQGKYIGHTGHPIYAPVAVQAEKPDHILVMNENYLEEIIKTVNNPEIRIESI
ncbi:MAG: methyltransferase domain-containing protein [Bacteroidetes bacterium]|nr:MAG: methyltransferase domain-containing protein [Bacteroidota bacterium]